MTPKVAIVHDYLNQAGGAERVVGTLHGMFPEAPIFTSILDRSTLWPSLRDADIRTSFMQHLPGVGRHFKKYLPLFPRAIESFDLSEFELVISSSSAFGKGAIVAPHAFHVCYCHTPMRFAWDYDRYVEREAFGRLQRAILPRVIASLRRWDLATASRPNVYVVNSSTVADRVKRCYGRESEIIPPPVDISQYTLSSVDAEYYLVVSRLNPYKRIDLVVDAFNKTGKPICIIGDGPDRPSLESRAQSNIQFLGRLPDADVAAYYARCRAVIFPGEEDFGIVPLEANASGRPVVAFKRGGALDTVIGGQTGVFFEQQTVEGLNDGIARAESASWDKLRLRRHAEAFGESVFRKRLMELLNRTVSGLRV